MSDQAPNWFVTQYNNRVMHKYQNEGFMLKGTVMPEGRIEGSKAIFPIAGKGSAKKKVRGQEATPMNANRTNVEAVLETWEAFDEVWTYDLSRMTANEKAVIEETGAWALGRATDAEIFEKAYSIAASSGTDRFLDGGTDGFAGDHALKMCQLLQKQEVRWDGNVFCPLPSLFWNQLMGVKQFNSADYVGPDLPFTRATQRKSWNGVHWFLMSNESVFNVPDTDEMDILLYHRSALGWCNNISLSTIWQWENRRGCWGVRMETEGAAAGLMPEGIIRGRFATNTDIVLN